MNVKEISSTFIDFYVQQGFELLPRAPLLDPSVPMSFVMSAGLVQVEAVGNGVGSLNGQKLVLLQKCFRHFDVDKVGADDVHLSFFEMPAAFVFGTFQKTEIVRSLWLLLTEHFLLDPNKLWVSYFAGGEKAGHCFSTDTSTRDAWLEVGLSPERLVGLDPQHNLWVQGDGIDGQNENHKCGPNTEVFWDHGVEYGCSSHCQPGCQCGRFLEIANALFVDKQIDTVEGSLVPTPEPFAEAVIGVERVAVVAQNKRSVFEIDYFATLNAEIESFCNPTPLEQFSYQEQVRILADHLRALVYLVADGAPPPWGTNGDKGGRHRLIRILIRRLLTTQKVLGIQDPDFMPAIVDFTIETSEDSCRLKPTRDKLLSYIVGEGKRFNKTLARGKRQLERFLQADSNGTTFPGNQALLLEKRAGMPKTMIEYELLRRGLRLDQSTYEQALQKWRKQTQ